MKKIFFYLLILFVIAYTNEASGETSNEFKSSLIPNEWLIDQIKMEEDLGRMMYKEGENRIKEGEIILIQETVKKTSPCLIEKGEQLVAKGEMIKRKGAMRIHQAQIRLRSNIKETKKKEQEIQRFLNEDVETAQ